MLPITVAVLTVLFAIQRYGTRLVGNLFGPVMAVWFGVLALTGVVEIAQHPASSARCRRPTARNSSSTTASVAFIALGSVVLAVTGAEALYADMGHFGRAPIRRAWFCARVSGAHAELPRAGLADPALARGRRPTRSFC